MNSPVTKIALGGLLVLGLLVFAPSLLREGTLTVSVLNDSGQTQTIALRLDAAPAAVQEQALGRLPPDQTATVTFRAPPHEASLVVVRKGKPDARSGLYLRRRESGKLKLMLRSDGRLWRQ